MINRYIYTKIIRDEFEGEKLINKFRFVLALLYFTVVILFAVFRKSNGLEPFPSYGYFSNILLIIYSLILYFYLNNRRSVPHSFKYICSALDMTIISISIFVGCSYPEIDPPIQYLSIWTLFYTVLILLGAFRYSIRCALFSGIFASFCYLIVIILRSNSLDFTYYYDIEDRVISLSFPTVNESFRLISLIVTGVIAAIASKRHLKLFSTMIGSQSDVSRSASHTVKKTQNMAELIQKSTDEIFLSSKNIFKTANNQAVSIQKIEATIKKNSGIAEDISEKTSEVASISVKMEGDVKQGLTVLEKNVEQLEEIKSKNESVINGIISLGNKIVKIRDIIDTINAITDQTKVIAFNAALEAASAGEYKKRFSIVSSEVNRLADDITALTKEIKKQADDIQSSSSSLIVSSKDSAEKIINGNKLIKELEEIFSEVRNGAETTAKQAQTITISSQKQQKSIEQINIAIADISGGLTNFIKSTEAATSSADDLSKTIKQLGNILNINSDEKENTLKAKEASE